MPRKEPRPPEIQGAVRRSSLDCKISNLLFFQDEWELSRHFTERRESERLTGGLYMPVADKAPIAADITAKNHT